MTVAELKEVVRKLDECEDEDTVLIQVENSLTAKAFDFCQFIVWRNEQPSKTS